MATVCAVGAGYLLVTATLAIGVGEPSLLPALLPVLLLVVLPGLLFVGAFSIACTELLPVPLYSILFTGYWFWGNIVPPSRMPTLSCTPLTPIGKYASMAFFHARGQECAIWRSLTPALGIVSIASLLAAGCLALAVTQAYLHWRAASR